MDQSNKDLKFGKTLRNIRNNRCLSVRQFAVRCGFSPVYISDLENNNRKPTIKVIEGISQNFDLSEEEHKMMMDAFAHDRLTIPVEVLYWILDNDLIDSLSVLKDLDPKGKETKNFTLQMRTKKEN